MLCKQATVCEFGTGSDQLSQLFNWILSTFMLGRTTKIICIQCEAHQILQYMWLSVTKGTLVYHINLDPQIRDFTLVQRYITFCHSSGKENCIPEISRSRWLYIKICKIVCGSHVANLLFIVSGYKLNG